jgi:hypothetical protein
MAANVINFGSKGVAGAAFGLLFLSADKAILSGQCISQPADKNLWKSKQEKESVFFNTLALKFKLAKEKEQKADEASILKVVMDQWIKSFVILDDKKSDSIATSAVQNTNPASNQ